MKLVLLATLAICCLANAIPTKDKMAAALYQASPDMELVEDDGTFDTALLNYLFTRQLVKRLRSGLDVRDLQQKRAIWKQCAFNAVTCFG
ncbi:hypothetical protein LAZ67_6000133 [Cordylochernes scorpioides]|uniref:Allatostatin C n=1 Tax=Cordylochernes scorpioides TaxID=51811 RepID=A0ABY6KIM7_9ARAC|nr:hypothetical protein LAZ67_6000133 [Cordylochernes scorpioides]